MEDRHEARARAPRHSLSRSRVVAAAVALADERGLGALTIRGIADRLGVGPMALYHHVAGKEEILDAIVDAVFVEMDAPVPGAPWRPELERRSRSARAVLARHPWALGLLETRRTPGPATLHHHDAVVGVLLEDGFEPQVAAHAYALLDAYVYGFALQESSLPFEAETADVVAEEMLAGMRDAYPHLARLAAAVVQVPGYDFADEFEHGLEVVLDGIAGLAARG